MLVRALVMVLALPLLLARKVVAVASHLQGKKRPESLIHTNTLAFKGRPEVVLDAVR